MRRTIYRLYPLIIGIILLSSLACNGVKVVTPTPGPVKDVSDKTEPPSASFLVDVDSGSAPLTVEFDNTSQGPATEVEWDFGDGDTSTSLSPIHRYTVAGTYDVRLSVSGPGGSDVTVMNQLITVEPGQVSRVQV